MDEQDKDLNQLLAGLNSFEPTAEEIGEWQNAVRFASKTNPRRTNNRSVVLQMGAVAAALVVGIFIGRNSLSNPVSKGAEVVENYSELDATLQYSFVKASATASSEKDL